MGGVLSDLFSFLSDHSSPQLQAGYILAPSKGGSLALSIGQPLGWVLGTQSPGSCRTRGGDRHAHRHAHRGCPGLGEQWEGAEGARGRVNGPV